MRKDMKQKVTIRKPLGQEGIKGKWDPPEEIRRFVGERESTHSEWEASIPRNKKLQRVNVRGRIGRSKGWSDGPVIRVNPTDLHNTQSHAHSHNTTHPGVGKGVIVVLNCLLHFRQPYIIPGPHHFHHCPLLLVGQHRALATTIGFSVNYKHRKSICW